MLLWQRLIVEINHGLFKVVALYFIEKTHGTFENLIISTFVIYHTHLG